MLIPKLQEIILPGSGEMDSYCETFVYEPSNIDEENLGSLYLVGQFDAQMQQSSSLLNLLASVIKREFYLNPKRKPIDAFEAALKKANATLADFIENEQIDWMGKIHLVCAVIQKQFLHLTQIGQATACLFRAGELVSVSQNLASLQKNPYPLKAFSSLVSGRITVNDRFVLATPCLSQHLSKLALKKVLALSQLAEAAKRIQVALNDKITNLPLAALLIEMQQPQAASLANQDWDKPSILPSEPIQLDEIIKETENRKQALIIPATMENPNLSGLSRPKALTKRYFQHLKKILRKKDKIFPSAI